MKNYFESLFLKPKEKKTKQEVPARLDLSGLDQEKLLAEMQSDIFKHEELIEALMKLVENLGSKLGDYEMILSDDASGRLPSLFLRKIINAIREKGKKESAKTFFVAGGRHPNERKEGTKSEIEHFIAGKKPKGRMLLVTEYIETGRSIERIMDVLDNQSIDYDVATVSVGRDPKEDPYYSEKLKKRLIYGKVGMSGIKLFNKPAYSGVTKSTESLNEEEEQKMSPHPHRSNRAEPNLMRQAREDIEILAQAVIDKIK